MLFVYKTDQNIGYLLAYVDDLLITGDSEHGNQKLIDQMKVIFSLKDLGEVSFFLSVEFTKTHSGLLLKQRKYITQLLKKTNLLLSTAYACSTTMVIVSCSLIPHFNNVYWEHCSMSVIPELTYHLLSINSINICIKPQ